MQVHRVPGAASPLFEPDRTQAGAGVWRAPFTPALFVSAARGYVRLNQRGRYL